MNKFCARILTAARKEKNQRSAIGRARVYTFCAYFVFSLPARTCLYISNHKYQHISTNILIWFYSAMYSVDGKSLHSISHLMLQTLSLQFSFRSFNFIAYCWIVLVFGALHKWIFAQYEYWGVRILLSALDVTQKAILSYYIRRVNVTQCWEQHCTIVCDPIQFRICNSSDIMLQMKFFFFIDKMQ